MTAAAKNTFGNKVFMNPAPTAATLLIAELLDFTPPELSRDTIDATTHDSAGGAAEYIGDGVYDAGELEIEIVHVARSAGDLALTTALTGGAVQNLKLQLKTATGTEDQTFQGICTSYALGGQPVKGGKQTATAKFKVSGPITKAATP